MATLNVKLDDELKAQALAVLAELNISPSQAIRQYLQFIAHHHHLPQAVMEDEDEDLIQIAKKRLENPQGFVQVTLDDL